MLKQHKPLFKNSVTVSGPITITRNRAVIDYYNVYYNGRYVGLVFPEHKVDYEYQARHKKTRIIVMYRYMNDGIEMDIHHLHDLYGRLHKLYKGAKL